MKAHLRLLAAAVGLAAAAALAGSGSGTASLAAPRPLAPAPGAVAEEMPAFAWGPIGGADHYEFQLAADRGFRSPVFTVSTWNARAAMTEMVPNGLYWWRVRGVSKSGQVSAWSTARFVRKAWATAPRLLSPTGGRKVKFPSAPLTLTWTPVPRAAKYLVSIATDEALASLVDDRPLETSATSVTPELTPGSKSKTYYWGVTPVDAQGNKGKESQVARFSWEWSSTTRVRFTDLRPEAETVDPQFSWDPVPGAAAYEIEINSSKPPDWAPSSRVCCKTVVVGTTFSPTQVFADNTYYWRVRAIDVRGNAGVWNYPAAAQTALLKVFDKQAQLGRPSIANLHMQGDASHVPVVAWDAVPGASEYLVDVAPYTGGICNWGERRDDRRFSDKTPNPYWTPLARPAPRVGEPYPANLRPRTDTNMAPGPYCVRVRAGSDKDTEGDLVYGDFTYINGSDNVAYTYVGPPCPGGCGGGRHLEAGSFGLPGDGVRVVRSPLLTWQTSAGATWWVLVAKDPQFHTVVDYAFVNVPAYAPRLTFPDEATRYYWTVLPSPNPGGSLASGDPLGGATPSFDKRSTPPSPVTPGNGASLTLAPRFHWTPVEGARQYHLEVSQNKDFGALLDDVKTDSVAYTSNTSYPADVALYWRVRAETSDGVALGWSPTRTFKYHLPAPAPSRRPAKADLIPTFRWSPVIGAISYDFHVDYPDGRSNDASDMPSAAMTAIKFTGPGVWHWKVRATFPTGRGRGVHGPWSKQAAFTKTIATPRGAATSAGSTHVLLSWKPTLGAASYSVQISPTPDFASGGRGERTELTSFAPSRTLRIRSGGSAVLYWRVAAEDEDHNVGAYTKPQLFRYPVRR